MKQLREILSLLLGFATLALIAWMLVRLSGLFLDALRTADAEVTAAIVGSLATVLVGLGAALYTQSQIRAREAAEAHRPKKIEIYNGFLSMAQRQIAAANIELKAKPVAEKELIDFLLGFKRDIVLWSSPGVINAFMEFVQKSSHGSGAANVLPAVDKLYREMRKDIGLSNWGLPQNQLVKINLRDPQELDGESLKGDL